ncbi:11485_t:CDS:2, partial [Ambispora leptoticha]
QPRQKLQNMEDLSFWIRSPTKTDSAAAISSASSKPTTPSPSPFKTATTIAAPTTTVIDHIVHFTQQCNKQDEHVGFEEKEDQCEDDMFEHGIEESAKIQHRYLELSPSVFSKSLENERKLESKQKEKEQQKSLEETPINTTILNLEKPYENIYVSIPCLADLPDHPRPPKRKAKDIEEDDEYGEYGENDSANDNIDDDIAYNISNNQSNDNSNNIQSNNNNNEGRNNSNNRRPRKKLKLMNAQEMHLTALEEAEERREVEEIVIQEDLEHLHEFNFLELIEWMWDYYS